MSDGAGRNFALLWTGQVVSQLGDSVYHIALVWLAIEMTDSSSLSSLVVSAGYVPAILFSLVAGAVVDAVDRRRLMVVCALSQALVVGAIPLAHRFGGLDVWLLAAVSFGLATASAFFTPARDALIPRLVERERLHGANSLMQISAQLAYLAGPAVAGVLVGVIGTVGLFTIDVGSFLLSAFALLLIAMPAVAAAHPAAAPVPLPELPKVAGGSWSEVREGLRQAWQDRRLRGLLLLTAADNLLIMGPALFGVPLYVRQVLQRGPSFYALLTAVLFSGMIISSLIIGAVGGKWRKGRLIITGIALDAATFLPFYFIRHFPLAALAMFVHGLTVPLITISRATFIHHHVPDHNRGKVFALINLAVVGFTALSVILVGPACDLFGVHKVFLIIGLAGGLFALGGVAFRDLWRAL